MAPFSIISTTAAFPFTLSILNHANDAAEKHKGDFHAICAYVKDKLDSQTGPAWHCIIGWKLISNVRFWKKKCIILGSNDGKQQFLIFQAPPPQMIYPSKNVNYNQLDQVEDESGELDQKKSDKLVNIETNHVQMNKVLEKFTRKTIKEIFKNDEKIDLTELTGKIKDELTSINGSTWHVIATESQPERNFGFAIDSNYENVAVDDRERCEIDLTVSCLTKLNHNSTNNKKEQTDRKIRLLIWKFEQKSFPLLEFMTLQHIAAIFLILGAVTFVFQFQKKYFQCDKCCTVIGRYAQRLTLQEEESNTIHRKPLEELLRDRGCLVTDDSGMYQCTDNQIETAIQCDDLCKWLMYASLFLIGVASCLKMIARLQKKQELKQKKIKSKRSHSKGIKTTNQTINHTTTTKSKEKKHET